MPPKTAASGSGGAIGRVGSLMAPLEWVNTALVAARDAVPAAWERSGLSYAAQKSELRPGDHVYAWKIGYTYNHHGVVVRTQECAASCEHKTMDCCSIVHFQPPEDDRPGRIELVSVVEFAQGRQVNRVRYGVSSTEFYLRRSGCCCTDKPDIWPMVVLRALSLLDVEPQPGTDSSPEAQVEYDLLKKNSELMARWCQLGDASGVHRFRSSETACSLQTSPGRFIRLGLAVAVPIAAVAVTAVAISGGAAGGAAAAGVATTAASLDAGTATAAAAGAAAGAGAGAAAASSAGGGTAGAAATATAAQSMAWAPIGAAARALSAEAVAAGSVATSAAVRALLLDAAARPRRAAEVLREVARTVPVPVAPVTAPQEESRRRSFDDQRRYREKQGEALVAALRDCFAHLGVTTSKAIAPTLESPFASRSLCEILVDLLEVSQPKVPAECAAQVQRFLDEVQG